MQTFLPYPDFAKTAACLDYRRLGKQRVEVLTMLKTLAEESQAWQNHPAVLMWKGYEHALILYGQRICQEWVKRGYKDLCEGKIIQIGYNKFGFPEVWNMPFWWNDEKFHASHRSNLLRKNPEYYGKFGWTEPNDLPYFWPVRLYENKISK